MKKIDSKTKKRIKGMRKKGFSYKEIAKKLGISVGSSYKYASDITLPIKSKKRLLNKMRKNKQKFIRKYAISKEFFVPESLSPEFIRILGHCLFDGCVSKDSVIYTNSSLKLIKEFKEDMKTVFKIEPSRIVKAKNKSEYYTLYYHYKKLSDYLKEISPSYSTSKHESKEVVEFVSKQKKSLIAEFLKTFWDDEGAVKKCKDITGKTKSHAVAKSLNKLHKNLGINIYIYKDTKNEAYELYLQRNKENLGLFKEKIGFRYGIVCRGHFKGLTKNQAFNIITK